MIPGASASRMTGRGRYSETLREWAIAATALAVSTVVALALRPYVEATNLVMAYLVGVVVVAMRCGRSISVAVSVLSVAAFDVFCVPPYLTFRVSDYQYLITFAGMLAVALAISTQAARIRIQAMESADRESRTEKLYRLSNRLAEKNDVFGIAQVAAAYAEEVFDGTVVIFFPEDGKISFRRRTSDRLPVASAEQAVAQWAFDHAVQAGRGAAEMNDASALYLPLKGAREVVGIMAVVPNDGGSKGIPPGQVQLLDVLAAQTALAIERTRSHDAADSARVRMQKEEMRSSLLSAVSHDLRTPLSSITGAASALRSQADKLDPNTRHELLDSIADEAERLSRLVSNLLDMTRLESGVELRRDYFPLEEIVGAALLRLEKQVEHHEVTVSLPENLPLVYADDVLLGQLIVNLLDNAAKYSPEGTTVEIVADFDSSVEAVSLEVRDRGRGLQADEPQRIFEKFYRRRADGIRGVGLGLAICRAIAEAHKGTIAAYNRPGGGAVFQVKLPLPKAAT